MNQTFTLQKKTVTGNKDKRYGQSQGIGVLYYDEYSEEECWETLKNLRDSTLDHEGQFISLDLGTPPIESFLDMLYTALKNTRWGYSFPFSLPIILQHNPRIASPFINHAILWQRLCDLLIAEEEPNRQSLLVLEHIDQSSPAVQHEIARLIRFHTTHSLQRTFIFTLHHHSSPQIIPELRDILDMQ